MKKVLLIALMGTAAASCKTCDCFYVTYDKGSHTNNQWKESYRSSWDTTCNDEVLNESTYTSHDGSQIHSKTVIECF